MEIIGNSQHPYHLLVDAYGVCKIYTFPTMDDLVRSHDLFKSLFPVIEAFIIKQP